jgi:hypothetical protein
MDLPYNRKIRKACGLSRMTPNRRTFDRRLVTISLGDIKNRTTMGKLFLCDKIIDPSIFFQQTVLLSRLKDMSGTNLLWLME